MIPVALIGLFAAQALAEPFDRPVQADLPGIPTAISIVGDGDGPRIAVVYADGVELRHPATLDVVARSEHGGVDAAMVPLPGGSELVVCGPRGLRSAFGATLFSEEPCTGIEAWGGRILLVLGETASVWSPAAGPPASAQPVGARVTAAPLLATGPDWAAVAEIGGHQVIEWSTAGRSSMATGGPVGGLAPGPRGWAWTLPWDNIVLDVTHTAVPVGPRPTTLATADVDGDGDRDLVVLHPAAVGLIRHGTTVEQIIADPADRMAVGRLDADACTDLVTAQGTQLRAYRGSACALAIPATTDPGEPPRPPVVPPPRPPAPPPARPTDTLDNQRILGVSVPPFVGVATDDRAVHDTLLGLGGVIGGSLTTVWAQIPAFMAASLAIERGSPKVRMFAGFDTAPLFLWFTDERAGVHLANGSIGVTVGGRRLSTGPFLTAGIWNVGGGWRTVWTPFHYRIGSRFGLESRMTFFLPDTAEAMLLLTWRYQRRRKPPASGEPALAIPGNPSEGAVPSVQRPSPHHAEPPATPRAPTDPVRGPGVCHRFGAAVGIEALVSSTEGSWEFVGSPQRRAGSWSPALAAACDTGGHGVGLVLGTETAPFASYLTKGGERRFHLASVTAGLMFGGDVFRAGPVASAGIWVLGVGGRAVVTPWRSERGARHGLELRGAYVPLSADVVQFSVAYTAVIDPRSGVRARRAKTPTAALPGRDAP